MEKDHFRLVEYFGSSKLAKQRLALLTLLESSSLHDDACNYTYYIVSLLAKMKFDEKNINSINPVIPVLCYTLLKTIHFTTHIQQALDPDTSKNFVKHLKTTLCSDDLKYLSHPLRKTMLPAFTSMIQQWCKEPSFRIVFQNTILPNLIQKSKVWNINQILIMESFCREMVYSQPVGKEKEILDILAMMFTRALRFPPCMNIVFRTFDCVTFRNFRKRIKRIYEFEFPMKIDQFQQKIIEMLGNSKEGWRRLVQNVGRMETGDRYYGLRLMAYISVYFSSKANDQEYRKIVVDELLIPTLRDATEDEVILECGLCTFFVLVGDGGWVGGKACGSAMDQLISTYTYLLTKKNIDVCKDLCVLLHFVREKYPICMKILRHILSHYRLHRNDYVELRNGNLRLNELIQVIRVVIRESIRIRLKQIIKRENGILMRRDYFTLLIREESFRELFTTTDEEDVNVEGRRMNISKKNKKKKITPHYIAKLRNVVVYCLFTEFLRQDPALGGDETVIQAWYIVGLSILKWGTDAVLLRPPTGYRSSLSAFGRVVVALLRYKGKVKESYYQMVSGKFIKDCIVRICPQLMSGGGIGRIGGNSGGGYLKTMLLVILSEWMGSFQTMGGKDSKLLFMSHIRQTLQPPRKGHFGKIVKGSDFDRKVSVDVLTGVLFRTAWRFENLRGEIMQILVELMESNGNRIGPIYESYLMTYRKVNFLVKYEKMMDNIKPEKVCDDHIVFSSSFFTPLDHEFYQNYQMDISSIFDEQRIRMNKPIITEQQQQQEEEEEEEEELREVVSFPDDPLYVFVVKNWRNNRTLDLKVSVRNDGLGTFNNVRVHIMTKDNNNNNYNNNNNNKNKKGGEKEKKEEEEYIKETYLLGGEGGGKGSVFWKSLRRNETKEVVMRMDLMNNIEVVIDILILISDRFTIRCDPLILKK